MPKKPLNWILLLGLITTVTVCIWRPLPIQPDFESYDQLGWNLAQGKGFVFLDRGITALDQRVTVGRFDTHHNPYLFRTPGYPLYLAAIYSLAGHHPNPVYITHILLHLLTSCLIYLLSLRFFNRQVALVATTLTILFPLTVIYIPIVFPEILSTFLFVLSVWLMIKTVEKNNPWLATFTGAIMAYSALVRPVFVLFPVFYFICIWLSNRKTKTLLKLFVWLHVGFFFVLSPWIVRNYKLTGEFIPLSTASPLQFWIGTLSTGEYLTRHWENPKYKYQQGLLNEIFYGNYKQFTHDKAEDSIEIQTRITDSSKLTPIKLHWRGEDQKVLSTAMDSHQPGIYSTVIPKASKARKQLSYYLTFRDPINPGLRFRYPTDSKNDFLIKFVPGILTYMTPEGKNLLADIGSFWSGAGSHKPAYCGWGKYLKANGIFPDGKEFWKKINSLPCIREIGLSSTTIDLRLNRAYLDLASTNLKENFWEILYSSLLRIPRIWLAVGTTDSRHAYQTGRSNILYPLLNLVSISIVILGIVGFFSSRKKLRIHWLLILPALYICIVHLPFHAEGRYSFQGRPFIFIYVSVALLLFRDTFKNLLASLKRAKLKR